MCAHESLSHTLGSQASHYASVGSLVKQGLESAP